MNFRGDVNFEKLWNGLLSTFLIFFIIIMIIFLVVLIIQIIAKCKVYKKAGRSGWEAIIPFYNSWVLCEIAGVEKWFFPMLIAGVIVSVLGLEFLSGIAATVSLGASFFCNYNIALKFKKDGIGFGLGLTLLPVIFYSILAFGDSKFEDIVVSKYGPVSDGTSNTSSTKSNTRFCKKCGNEVGNAMYCENCGEKVQ